MFPSGRAGVGLALLRFCLIGMLLRQAWQLGPIDSLHWAIPVIFLIAAALALGFATTAACAIYCAGEIGFACLTKDFGHSRLLLGVPLAIALALLRPGAYSLESRLFGRRVIVVFPPPEDET